MLEQEDQQQIGLLALKPTNWRSRRTLSYNEYSATVTAAETNQAYVMAVPVARSSVGNTYVDTASINVNSDSLRLTFDRYGPATSKT